MSGCTPDVSDPVKLKWHSGMTHLETLADTNAPDKLLELAALLDGR